MRFVVVALLVLLPAAAFAQGQSQSPANCGPLQMVNTISMVRGLDGRESFVPILFDAGWKYFLFDTGGSRTQVTQTAASDMKLELHDGTVAVRDITGQSLAKMARINQFVLGHLKSDGAYFPVTPLELADADGIFALDYLLNYDADVDFGTDTLNFFSQNHCSGHVIYWQAPAVAQLPLKMDDSFHMTVPVTIDGQQVDALIDTGATDTSLRSDFVEDKFHLTLGDADTPKAGALNGVASLVTYRHVFKTLTFGDVTVSNPQVLIFPAERTPYIGSMGRVPGNITGPVAIIGMDVLRKLHLYMAFKEGRLYVSAASVSDKPPAAYPAAYLTAYIARWSDQVARFPEHSWVWSNRCLWRGIAKTELDGALADCEQSLKLQAGRWDALYGKGIVLYQQGKYQDALAAFDSAVGAGSQSEPLFMRSQTRAKLGDSAGSKADLESAKALDQDVQAHFQKLGLAN